MNRFFYKFIYREITSQKNYSLQVILSVAIGVGAVVGINSYKLNLKNAIQREAKNIMGGDLTLSSTRKLSPEAEELIEKTLPQQSRTTTITTFSSMLSNPGNEETNLSMVKVLGDAYPFYGEIVTKPRDAYQKLQDDEILLEANLVKNLKLKFGDSVTLGYKTFKYTGTIEKQPAITSSFLSMAPASMIKASAFASTGLESRGSRIRYNILIQLPKGTDSAKFKEKHFPTFIQENLTLYHSTEIGSGSQRFISNTFDFMSLLGLSAFFLGAIAILLASKTRISSRANEIAVLKCLGAKTQVTIQVFLLELLLLSFIGVGIGIFTAYYFQFLIPDLTGSPFLKNLQPTIYPISLAWGLIIGFVVPLFVGLESIFQIASLSPLNALRSEITSSLDKSLLPSRKRILQVLCTYLLFFGIATMETSDWKKGLSLSLALAVLPVILFALYMLLRYLSGSLLHLGFPSRTFRIVLKKIHSTGHGLSLAIIGIGSALSILLISLMLRNSLLELGGANQVEKRPNVFVLDIKKQQLEIFQEEVKSFQAKSVYIAPIIGARLSKINGEFVEKENTESDAVKRDWKATAKTREYFLSYRDKLYDSEKIAQGEFWEAGDKAQLSVEKDFAKSLGVKLGDSLTFNVQGREITATITSTRKVSWSDMKPNFVVLFSPGVLEKAPAYYLSSFIIEDAKQRYQFQKSLVKKCPNITAIDIEESISRFMGILNKVTDIIDLMTYFILGSSILLLITSLYANQKKRMEETALMRVIGANSNFLRKMYSWEAIWIGIFSFFASLLLAVISTYIISEQVLNVNFQLPLLSLVVLFCLTLGILVFVYLFNIRKLVRQAPKSYLEEIL
ncbi:MAG: FtsX-like permease family protein [Spirochaetota bacterium]